MAKNKCNCGKDKYDWQDICYHCREEKEVNELKDSIIKNGESSYEKYIICPYCGYHHGEDDENESRDIYCDECGKNFRLELEYEVHYSTSKIEEEIKPKVGITGAK